MQIVGITLRNRWQNFFKPLAKVGGILGITLWLLPVQILGVTGLGLRGQFH